MEIIDRLVKRRGEPINMIGLEINQESGQNWNPFGTAISLGVLSMPYLMDAGWRLALLVSDLGKKHSKINEG